MTCLDLGCWMMSTVIKCLQHILATFFHWLDPPLPLQLHSIMPFQMFCLSRTNCLHLSLGRPLLLVPSGAIPNLWLVIFYKFFNLQKIYAYVVYKCFIIHFRVKMKMRLLFNDQLKLLLNRELQRAHSSSDIKCLSLIFYYMTNSDAGYQHRF